MSDDKTKHVNSFGKGRKHRRLQFRQARAGQLATVAVSAPPVGSDSESNANDRSVSVSVTAGTRLSLCMYYSFYILLIRY